MNKRRMSGKRLSLVGRVVAVAAIVLALAVPASAAAIYPDLKASHLVLTWDGTNFTAVDSLTTIISWTDPTGTLIGIGSPVPGDVLINWNGSSGTLYVADLTVAPPPNLGTILQGTFNNFSPMLLGSDGDFSGVAHLTISLPDGMTNDVVFNIISDNMTPDPSITGRYTGTGNADIYPAVPEPATLGLLSVGLGALAVRRRKARR